MHERLFSGLRTFEKTCRLPFQVKHFQHYSQAHVFHYFSGFKLNQHGILSEFGQDLMVGSNFNETTIYTRRNCSDILENSEVFFILMLDPLDTLDLPKIVPYWLLYGKLRRERIKVTRDA